MTTSRASRAAAFASVLAIGAVAFSASCEPAKSPSPEYVVRLRVPLRDEPARACEAECASQSPDGTRPYLECISGCPGAELADGATCGDSDCKPAASCWVVEVREEVQPDGSVLLGILGAVATAGVIAAGRAIESSGKPHDHVHHVRRSDRDGG